MGFTPIVSLSTAIIEFIIATYILVYLKRSRIAKGMASFILVLGLYQFTEFMLCTSLNSFWANIGFATYTILPALGLHIILKYINKKVNYPLIYSTPLFFMFLALLKSDFIVKSSCGNYFVTIQNILQQPNLIYLGIIYLVYYFGFISVCGVLLIKHYKKQNNKLIKALDIDAFVALTISLIPAVILLFVFPMISYAFPSIYCQFAIFFTIAGVIACYLEHKIETKKKK